MGFSFHCWQDVQTEKGVRRKEGTICFMEEKKGTPGNVFVILKLDTKPRGLGCKRAFHSFHLVQL